MSKENKENKENKVTITSKLISYGFIVLVLLIIIFSNVHISKNEAVKKFQTKDINNLLIDDIIDGNLTPLFYNIDWSSNPFKFSEIQPFQNKIKGVGDIFLTKDCKTELDYFNNPFSNDKWLIPICSEGITIHKSMFKIEHFELNCKITKEDMNKYQSLSNFVDSLENNLQIDRNHESIVNHIIPSNISDNLGLLERKNKVLDAPDNFISWFQLIFNDIDWNSLDIKENGFRIPLMKQFQFRFNSDKSKVKFGIKTFSTNEFYEVIDSTIRYGEVIAIYNKVAENWKMENTIKYEIYDAGDFEILLEQDSSTRILFLVILTYLILGYFVLKYILILFGKFLNILFEPFIADFKVLYKKYYNKQKE